MKWISCNKAMPAKGLQVIVWVYHTTESQGSFTESWLDDDGWAMGSAKGFTVTHWMKIDAPKGVL